MDADRRYRVSCDWTVEVIRDCGNLELLAKSTRDLVTDHVSVRIRTARGPRWIHRQCSKRLNERRLRLLQHLKEGIVHDPRLPDRRQDLLDDRLWYHPGKYWEVLTTATTPTISGPIIRVMMAKQSHLGRN